MEPLLQQLEREGWHVDLEDCEDLQDEDIVSVQTLRRFLLNYDLKKVGKPSLPREMASIPSGNIAGPVVLQVQNVADISRPSYLSGTAGGKRLMRLRLYDGATHALAIEFKKLEGIDEAQLMPGTKVKLTGASVKGGIFLLDNKCLQVLGGRVEHLAQAWEVQRKYGGTQQRNVQSGDDTERAPSFTHFVPGRDDRYYAHTRESVSAGARPSDNKHQSASNGRSNNRGARASTADGGRSNATPSSDLDLPPGLSQDFRDGPRRSSAPATRQRVPESQPEPSNTDPAPPPRAVQPAPAATQQMPGSNEAAKKLLECMQEPGFRGRGRGRFGDDRGGRRGRGRRSRFGDDDDDEGGSMTLDEWEAAQKSKSKPTTQQSSSSTSQLHDDEMLARRLHAELNMGSGAPPSQPKSAVDDLKAALFSFTPQAEEPEPRFAYGRGSARGRGRGRGGGRGRGRGR